MDLTKRGLLKVGASSLLLPAGAVGAVGAAYGQEESGGSNLQVPRRRATTKILFKAPSGFPNAVASTAEGLWIAEQKPRGATEKRYNLTYPADSPESVWLVDANGKVVRVVANYSE